MDEQKIIDATVQLIENTYACIFASNQRHNEILNLSVEIAIEKAKLSILECKIRELKNKLAIKNSKSNIRKKKYKKP